MTNRATSWRIAFQDKKRGLVAIKAVLLGLSLYRVSEGYACGPFFPNFVLTADKTTWMGAPEGEFQWAIGQLKLPMVHARWPYKTDNPEVERQELRQALTRLGHQPAQIETLMQIFARFRATTASMDEQLVPETTALELDKLPPEFAYYARGALAYRAGQNKDAVNAWQTLIELPAQQRQYRSAWAAYMLGKIAARTGQSAASIAWFRQVREYVQKGFSDSQGLASASLGEEAREELKSHHYAQALTRYHEQLATGDEQARVSILLAARTIFNSATTDELLLCAQNDSARGILNAYMVSVGITPDDAVYHYENSPALPSINSPVSRPKQWLGSGPK